MILPEGAQSISEYAFSGCTTLQSVVLPSSVKEIGHGAFMNCTALSTVTFGEGLEIIGNNAFSSCTSLTSISTPRSLKVIGNYAFDRCEGLVEVNLNEGLERIENSAFNYCHRIRELSLPDSLLHIGDMDYMNGLIRLEIGTNLGVIEDRYFLAHCFKICEIYDRSALGVGTSIRNGHYGLTVNYYTATEGESHLTEVADYCFFENNDGEVFLMAYDGEDASIVLPEEFGGKEYTVWYYALAYNQTLTSVTFSSGVKDIKNRIIAFSPLVRELCVDAGNATYYAKSNCVIKRDYGYVILGCQASVIPTTNDVTKLWDYSFYGCEGLTQITVPSNIDGQFAYSAFAECKNLTYAQLNCNKIEQSMFENCSALKEVRLGEGVQSIGNSAFQGCDALEKINLPSSLVSVSQSAFIWCENFLQYDDEGCAYLGGWLIDFAKTDTTPDELVIKAGTVGIASGALENSPFTKITLPDSVKYIGGSAFSNNDVLTTLILPEGVVSIGYSAFADCPELQQINIPRNITSFVNSHFMGGWFDNSPKVCETVDGVVYIDTWVVDAEEDITVAKIREGTVGIASYAFEDCTLLQSVLFPSGLKYIEHGAFADCESLGAIELPEGLLTLEDSSLCGTAITELLLPKSLSYLCVPFGTIINEVPVYIYYQGTRTEYAEQVSGNGVNSYYNVFLYYYSATEPTDGYHYWHYEGDTPTPWSV